jgi:5-methylcytosine-specific restriction endonuclease McrA
MTTNISATLCRQIRADAGERCGYCLSAETLMGVPLEVEHLHPESLGGQTMRDNLRLACYRCNKGKGNRIEAIDPLSEQSTPIFNPRLQLGANTFVGMQRVCKL